MGRVVNTSSVFDADNRGRSRPRMPTPSVGERKCKSNDHEGKAEGSPGDHPGERPQTAGVEAEGKGAGGIMWRVDGFKTKAEADEFKKQNGGIVLWEEYTPKLHKPTSRCKDWLIATQATGIDREKYPFVVERRI